ncbi:carbamoyltransferase HypF [Microbulbifer guangxiensis]|uniref:carbamoyltransferase HypF n=1 Tax=Microbulbifer guangxiensis TaxID=2904249 RepID=UPI001F021253|nr:carbamoyltransferase HypF [Microbulbifer guangxiensis]
MTQPERWGFEVTGLVQGVGFRPFVLRLAHQCELSGWVANHSRGVRIEAQGARSSLRRFLRRLDDEKPGLAQITSLQVQPLEYSKAGKDTGFTIRESERNGPNTATLLPDLAPCAQCLREIFDPGNRRYGYPFTNCTSCGPRYSIVERLPYDRIHTAMRGFPLCPECEREYGDPQNRRFHAEPNACPTCGPQLQLMDSDGNVQDAGQSALMTASDALAGGAIVAMKSVGGFQLLCRAGDANTVARLRQRKQRPDKPFALLYADLSGVRKDCHLSEPERQLLASQARPIVLLQARAHASRQIAAQVAPGNPNLGVMLPCSPLHYLLMDRLGVPVVATSGNRAGEPICIDNDEALARLGAIADLFLVHDRPVLRPLDDSVARIMRGQMVLLRRARGFAPLPLELALPGSAQENGDLLAVGADLKNAVAVCRGNTVYCSQHIGDLGERRSRSLFESTIRDISRFNDLDIKHILTDRHPGYASTRWATAQGLPQTPVQHHVAHFFSAMAEHGFRGRALGICWDGSGYGEGGILRGSEFMTWDGGNGLRRLGGFRPFPLPGAEQAIREPRRSAAGLLYTAMRQQAFSQPALRALFTQQQIPVLTRMLERGINSPECSSAGRLFDAVAGLLGLAKENSFEGQAAMAVEFAAQCSGRSSRYSYRLTLENEEWILDWEPMLAALLTDIRHQTSTNDIARTFHNTLVQMILSLAKRSHCKHVFLSGGVFQNRILAESAATALEADGFTVYLQSRVPPNDGGIALGQIYYARIMSIATSRSEEGNAQCV